MDRGLLPPINREGIGSWVDILGGGVGGADGRRQGNFHQIRDLQFQETKIADEVYMRVGGVSCPHVRCYEQAPGGGGGGLLLP